MGTRGLNQHQNIMSLQQKHARLMKEYGLSAYEARVYEQQERANFLADRRFVQTAKNYMQLTAARCSQRPQRA